MIGNYVMADENIIESIKRGELSAGDFLYDENDEMPEGSIDIYITRQANRGGMIHGEVLWGFPH
jgi:hypothetical protein